MVMPGCALKSARESANTLANQGNSMTEISLSKRELDRCLDGPGKLFFFRKRLHLSPTQENHVVHAEFRSVLRAWQRGVSHAGSSNGSGNNKQQREGRRAYQSVAFRESCDQLGTLRKGLPKHDCENRRAKWPPI